MPDFYLDVDSPLAEVPVNLLPLTSSADQTDIVSSLAYNAAGLQLYWNFVTSAGQFSRTQVVPTSGGSYNWTQQGGGMFTVAMPASGGDTVNNDTEGVGWFTGVANGVMHWVGPRIGFRAAALNDMFQDGGGLGPLYQFGIIDQGPAQSVSANSIQLRAAAPMANDTIIGALVRIRSASTGVGQMRVITDYIAATQTAMVSPDWAVTPTGSIEYVIVESAPAPTDAAVLPGVRVDAMSANTLTASAVAADAVAEIQSGISAGGLTQEQAQAAAAAALTAYDPPTKAELDAAVAPLATAAALATVGGYVDTEVAALATQLTSIGNTLTAVLQDTGTDIPALIAALNDVSLTEIFTTQLTQSYAANGVAPTLAQFLFGIQQHLMEFTISGDSRTVRQLDGTTTAFVETIERDGNGLAVGLSR